MLQDSVEETNAVVKFETEQWASIGQQLRQARERQHWTVQDAAKRLCLSTDIINALEDDDFQHAPGLMFMRGYLKSYARVLGLPLDCIMQQFADLKLTVAPNRLATSDIILKTGRPLYYRLKSWVVAVVALLLATLVMLWWQSGRQHQVTKPVKSKLIKTTTLAPLPSTASVKPDQAITKPTKSTSNKKTDSTKSSAMNLF